MVRLTDRPAMTIVVDLGRKATKQTNRLGMANALLPLKKLLRFDGYTSNIGAGV